MRRSFGRIILGLVLWITSAATAQLSDLQLTVEPGALGLDGVVRPGAWTPLRLLIDNRAAVDREVSLRWEVADVDGDRVVSQRTVTLTRQRDGQAVWLYAPVPMTTARDSQWTISAVDTESNTLLASLTLQPEADRLLLAGETLLAATTNAELGLGDYQRHETMQPMVRIIRSLSLGRLPDRWYGLEALGTLIWTQDRGGDPADPQQVSEAALAALREWVYRGGHLVIVLPAAGQTWTTSPLADLLPVADQQVRRVETDRWAAPDWMGTLKPLESPALSTTTFAVDNEPTTSSTRPRPEVLLRDEAGQPIVVAGRFGFGRVTLVGIDLTQPAVRAAGMPSGGRRLWNHVFNWPAPVLTQDFAEAQTRENLLVPASRMGLFDLTDFFASRIAMTGTVGTLLLLALLFFGLYWVVVGWLLQPLLKRRGLERKTWLIFAGAVLLTAGVAWGGAALLRPSTLQLTHLTILDLDGNRGIGRARSMISAFVPTFGDVPFVTASPPIPALGTAAHNTLSSPGLLLNSLDAGFLDTQTYRIDAADPDHVSLPMRSTSKQLLVDYLGPIDGDLPGLEVPASVLATQPITLDADGWPTGELLHTLPGALTNVRLIFCRGEAFDQRGQRRALEPMIWDYANVAGVNRWEPQSAWRLTGRPADYELLYTPWQTYTQIRPERDWNNEGFLGRRLGEQGGAQFELGMSIDESVIARQLELLTFFEALPPPDFKRDPAQAFNSGRETVLGRRLGTRLDLSNQTMGRRLIVMGLLRDAPLTIPLTIEDQTPPGRGWTAVRWIYDF